MNKQVAKLPAKTGKPAAKSLKKGPNFKVALPREAHESNGVNDLQEGLGKARPIELQGVPEASPKLFDQPISEIAGPIDVSRRGPNSPCLSWQIRLRASAPARGTYCSARAPPMSR
jgi:hypothetical protein